MLKTARTKTKIQPEISFFSGTRTGNSGAVNLFYVSAENTAQERDPETSLYYFGARYLDPKTSRWLSTDPAMYQGDYIPGPDRGADKLGGMGGVFNYVNLHVYHYGGNNPIKYVDPDGRTIEYEKLDTANDEDVARVQRAVETVMNSDTEAGRRLRELHDNTDVTVIVKVTRNSERRSGVNPGIRSAENSDRSKRASSNNRGTDSTVYLNVFEMARESAFFGREVFVAHELSGHAYDNYKGTNPRNRGGDEAMNRRFSEQRAVAMENEYKSFIGQNQRSQYDSEQGSWNMPRFHNGKWYLEGRPWNLR
jgi:RHS repeat-associated protein